ncbi:aminotransferase class I/II-fold pyridoxal phosphate-dependent enzyme [Candidatus Bipolaricaulota bacterium]
MRFARMPLEEWFDTHQYTIQFDIGESAVRTLSLDEIDIDLSRLRLRYGHHTGGPELRERVAAQYSGLSRENIVVTNGAAEALFDIASALLAPRDHVIVEHPNYPSNYEVPRSLGCEVDLLPLRFGDDFRPDLDELERQMTPATKLISLTHPNNPTGSVISEGELLRLIELAERFDCHLILDETYRDLVYSEPPLPAAASLSRNAISVSSMSKAFGVPGIRIGWMATQDAELLENVVAVREQVSICNSAFGEAVADAVLSRHHEYVSRARAAIATNLDLLTSWMRARSDLEWVPPAAGVVCFPRLSSDRIEDPEALYRHLAKDRGTFVIPGRCFEQANHFFRIGFGGEIAELGEGLMRLATAIDTFPDPCRKGETNDRRAAA